MTSFYEFSPEDAFGKPFPFKDLKGKVVLIVNVASKCGYTHQYSELQALYDMFEDQGFVVLAFPCNQFGEQEPESMEAILEFGKTHFGITFPVLRKIDVNGPYESEVYTFLKSQRAGWFGFKGLKWNFEKFLVDRSGNVVGRWLSSSTPLELTGAVKKALEAKS